MSHIYIKGNRWYITYRLSGRQHHFSLCVPTYTSRHRILHLQDGIDHELTMSTFDPKVLKGKIESETTLYDFLDQLKEYYKKNQRKFSSQTLDDYLYSIKLLKDIITDLPISRFTQKVTDGEVMSYLYENYSHASVRHHSGSSRSLFNSAVKCKYLDENPLHGLVPRHQRRIPQYYSREDIEAMRVHFKERPAWQYDMVFLALNTSLRKSELLILDWDRHVDLKDQQLKFPGKEGKKDLFL